MRLVIGGGTRSGSVELPVAAAAHEVFSGRITSAPELKKRLHDVTPSNEEFKDAVANCRVSVAKLARYYLRSMVMPKKPGDGWAQFTQEEADHWLTRLGNPDSTNRVAGRILDVPNRGSY